MKDCDVVIVGSGIGGLCCASLLSLQGLKVIVCEAHSKPGGVAHSFDLKGYKFESGPSLFSGLEGYSPANPLGQILKLIEEPVEVIKYLGWRVLLPDSNFDLNVGYSPFREKIKELRGLKSLEEWDNFVCAIKPISDITKELPLLSLSSLSSNPLEIIKLTPKFLGNLQYLPMLRKGFGEIAENHLNDTYLKNWVDLLSFLISGMSMYDTNTAAMATLFDEWFSPDVFLEYPKGGSESIVNALSNGIKKNGGEIMLSSKVEEIQCNQNKVQGIKLKNGSEIKAPNVVLNCDIWSAQKLIPGLMRKKWKNSKKIAKCDSFLHLHLGFDGRGLENLPIHTIWVNKWERGITAERNIAVFSIPSVLDPGMAPPGKHVLHAYTPANEPWEIWKNLKTNSTSYKKLKEKRCSLLLNSLREFIPDIDE